MKPNCIPVQLKMVFLRAQFAPFSTEFTQYFQWEVVYTRINFQNHAILLWRKKDSKGFSHLSPKI